MCESEQEKIFKCKSKLHIGERFGLMQISSVEFFYKLRGVPKLGGKNPRAFFVSAFISGPAD